MAPCGKVGQRFRARRDERIADIGAWQRRGDGDAVGEPRRQVLGGVDGEIDLFPDQRLVDLLAEQALAAGLGERPVGDAVAGRADGHNDHVLGRQRKRREQAPLDFFSLRQRQRAAARSDAELCRLQEPGSRC